MAFSWTKETLESMVPALNTRQAEIFAAAKELALDPDSVEAPLPMSVVETDKKKFIIENAVPTFTNDMLPEIAATLGTTIPSVRSKLTNLGLYIANAKVDKPKNLGAPKVTRDVIVGNCEKLIEEIGEKPLNLSTFAKASKSSLEDLQEFLTDVQARFTELELEESTS